MKTRGMGDIVFTADAVWSCTPIKCPVCAGTTRVLVKPVGTDDSCGMTVRCEYCQHTELGPGLVEDRWTFVPAVRSFVIEGVESRTTTGRVETWYLFNVTRNSCSRVKADQVYGTKAEADIAAQQQSAKANAEADKRRIGNSVYSQVHPTWTAGRCRKELDDLEKRFEYFEEQLGVLSKKRRPKKSS